MTEDDLNDDFPALTWKIPFDLLVEVSVVGDDQSTFCGLCCSENQPLEAVKVAGHYW